MSGWTLMAIAWIGVITWISFVIYANRKTHPKALFLLFFAEFWERFSYYGMRALLILYMAKSMGYSDDTSYGVYAAYGAMVYATPIVGGLLSEKLLGYRKAIFWGGTLMALGHFAMAFEYELIFYLALALLIAGNGFFKPNISSFIATFYEKNDPRKDSAYTIFYMGINAGAMLTPLTCGFIGEKVGWHYGFGLAGVGMVLGLVVFVYARAKGYFEDNGHPARPEVLAKKTAGVPREMLVYILSFASLPVVMVLLRYNEGLATLLGLLGVAMIGYLLWVGKTEDDRDDGQRVYVIVILFLFTILFFTFFELAGSAITLYTDRNVDMNIAGTQLKASMFQAVNPLFILAFAPIFSFLWGFLNRRNLEPSSPFKFALGLILLGVGFFMFTLGKGFADNGLVPVMWLVLAYLGHTLGELCISPVGLSLVTKLSPDRLVGLIMGIWFLSYSLAHQIGAVIAKLTSSGEGGEKLPPVESLPIYTEVFTNVGLVAIGGGVLLVLLTPSIKKWMHGVH
jgi:POT family proton-dependent oligopeptide transporter